MRLRGWSLEGLVVLNVVSYLVIEAPIIVMIEVEVPCLVPHHSHLGKVLLLGAVVAIVKHRQTHGKADGRLVVILHGGPHHLV